VHTQQSQISVHPSNVGVPIECAIFIPIECRLSIQIFSDMDGVSRVFTRQVVFKSEWRDDEEFAEFAGLVVIEGCAPEIIFSNHVTQKYMQRLVGRGLLEGQRLPSG